MLSVVSQPKYFSSLYNPILFSFYKSDYALGQLTYLDLYKIASTDIKLTAAANSKTGTLLKSFIKNGNGRGEFIYDISNLLQSTLPSVVVPNATKFQSDASSYVGYYVTGGTISFDANLNQIKTQVFESTVKWAFRAAFALGVNTDTDPYWVDYIRQAKFLTNLPANAELIKDQNQYLYFILPKNPATVNVKLMADINYKSSVATNIVLSENIASTGSVYAYNINPSLYLDASQLENLRKISFWVEHSAG